MAENSPARAQINTLRNVKTKLCFPNSTERDEVSFEAALSSKVQNGEKTYELAKRENELRSQTEEINLATSGVWTNDMSVSNRCSDISPKRKTNSVQQWKSFESGANSFCTDNSSSIWEQCRTPYAEKSQFETVWEKPSMLSLDITSSMSQTTESTRDEYFEWETFLSPFSSAANVLQTPEKPKLGPGKLLPSFMCPSTPENYLSLFNERMGYSPPLRDSDFSLRIDKSRVQLSPLSVLLEDYFSE